MAAPSFRLWHCVGARSFRCLWAMTELELPASSYELITMPFPPRVSVGKKYVQKTGGLGTIPYFEDLNADTYHSDDGGYSTTKGAIPQYIAHKYRPASTLLVGPTEDGYADYLNWIAHADATLTFPQTVVLRYTLQEPGRADNAAADYAKWFIARLRRLDNTLADGREFLCSDRFTIADICISYSLFLGTTLELNGSKLSERYKPQTAQYLERMQARQGYKVALAAEMQSHDDFDATTIFSKDDGNEAAHQDGKNQVPSKL